MFFRATDTGERSNLDWLSVTCHLMIFVAFASIVALGKVQESSRERLTQEHAARLVAAVLAENDN